MKRIVYHIDVNSAYLSWSAIDILKTSDLDIRQIPSVVGGERDKRSGIVLSKSIPSKKYGISVGEPVNMALQKYKNLYVAKPDFESYEKHSKDFIEICKTVSPTVEQFSIDECYIDMTGMETVHGDIVEFAHKLKDRIYSELGFTVNIGVGNNKFLAKMASDFEKPNKVHTLFLEEIEKKMYPLPIGDLYLVGRKMKDAFLKAGVITIADLAKLELSDVQRIAGSKMGEVYYNYVRGIDDTPVVSDLPEAKSYSISRTFENDITTRERAYAILLLLSDEVASRMRADDKSARVISVVIRTSRFEDTRKQITLLEETDSTSEIYEVSKELFDTLWDEHTPLRLLGVGLAGIISTESIEGAKSNSDSKLNEISMSISDKDSMNMIEYLESLLNNESQGEENTLDTFKSKNRKIDKAVDELRKKFGYEIINRGSILKEMNENDD